MANRTIKEARISTRLICMTVQFRIGRAKMEFSDDMMDKNQLNLRLFYSITYGLKTKGGHPSCGPQKKGAPLLRHPFPE
jgi:hypothetical protein